ncbi:GlxA family transcriptional regulator [Segnochrobactraceae bacterium EtOH-i3]
MRLALLAYDGISPFLLSTPLAVFGEPFLASGHRVDICAAEPVLTATGGLGLVAPFGLERAAEADVVILPGWRSPVEPVTPALVETLRAAHARGAVVMGLCLGAFGLAEAGLLNGRRATTHWAGTAALARRFPEVDVDPGALFVDEGAILTSAGVAAGLDCCLHFLARSCGVAEANRVARHLVVAPQRTGEQPQLIERPAIGSSAEHRVSGILERLARDPSGSPALDDLALEAGMSRRSFTRHVRARTGGSLGDWLRALRVARASELLAGGGRGLDDIAARCGFSDAAALRSAFRAELGLTPSQWLARQRLG